MVISNKVQQFIEKYIPLIDANKFTYVYKLAQGYLERSEIGELTQALMSCGINPIEIDPNLTSIPTAYLWGCNDITSFILEDKEIDIVGNNAFSNCDYLKQVFIDCQTIQSFAFVWCKQLKSITLTKRLKYLDVSCFFACANFDTIYYKGTKEDFMINVHLERTDHIVGKRGGVIIRFNDGTSAKLDEFYKK